MPVMKPNSTCRLVTLFYGTSELFCLCRVNLKLSFVYNFVDFFKLRVKGRYLRHWYQYPTKYLHFDVYVIFSGC
jgi:hypothetical protein